MPKPLFYIGIVCCVFLAVAAAGSLAQELDGTPVSFIALHGQTIASGSAPAWAIVVALLAAVAVAAILLRMAALLAARNLFGAFLALFSVSAAVFSLAWVVVLQVRMLALARRRLAIGGDLGEMHLAAVMMLAYFVALSFFALRPYFKIQASRFLSALVFFPLPLLFVSLARRSPFAAGLRSDAEQSCPQTSDRRDRRTRRRSSSLRPSRPIHSLPFICFTALSRASILFCNERLIASEHTRPTPAAAM